jgi:hypothetical protein
LAAHEKTHNKKISEKKKSKSSGKDEKKPKRQYKKRKPKVDADKKLPKTKKIKKELVKNSLGNQNVNTPNQQMPNSDVLNHINVYAPTSETLNQHLNSTIEMTRDKAYAGPGKEFGQQQIFLDKFSFKPNLQFDSNGKRDNYSK